MKLVIDEKDIASAASKVGLKLNEELTKKFMNKFRAGIEAKTISYATNSLCFALDEIMRGHEKL